jgi:hypothetical protein
MPQEGKVRRVAEVLVEVATVHQVQDLARVVVAHLTVQVVTDSRVL